jgi:hypothetical protein
MDRDHKNVMRRPVFAPTERGASLVQEIAVAFVGHPGWGVADKKSNVAALHEAAAAHGLAPLLEISTRSEQEVGRGLSAFNLAIKRGSLETTIECAYQGSKVFERGGPFADLYRVDSRAAKTDPRLRDSGPLVGYRFEERDYPLSPPTAFFDWLYFQGLMAHPDWLAQLAPYAGFTDIEFHPGRSRNCQARSCATIIALQKRNLLDESIASFDRLRQILQTSAP